ncbi:MAG: lactaldehyde reductase [Gallicola sp.]|nr:lactaldehyde reductase [Gallicola sp.]
MENRIILNELSYHGYGALDGIGEVMQSKGYGKAVVFSDAFLKESGLLGKITEILDRIEIPYEIFTAIDPNPSIKNVLEGLESIKKAEADVILAVGGGSVMDCAKAAGIVHTNPEFSDVSSLAGVADTKKPATPIIAVATTAGTASEVTINYVITDTENKKKLVCVDPHVLPVAAIVDPTMMETMPADLTAATGMDALTHAIEGYITKGAWEMTDMFHLEAIKWIAKYLPAAVRNEKKGREMMALAQYTAGMGFSNVGLGIVHSMAHPLGALYNTPHGVANAIILPTVMEYNAENTGEKYKHIARVMGVEGTEEMTEDEYRKAAVKAVRDLAKEVNIPESLAGIIEEKDISFLADSAMKDACTPGNPKDPTKEEIEKMYQDMLK